MLEKNTTSPTSFLSVGDSVKKYFFAFNSKSYLSFTEFLVSVIVSICIFKYIRFHWGRRRMYQMAAKIPGPPWYPFIGSAYIFFATVNDVLQVVSGILNTYKSPAKMWLPNRLCFIINRPEHLEAVFTNPKCINKEAIYDVAKPVVGNGLFTATGNEWRKNRKHVSVTFNHKMLNSFQTIFTDQSTVLIEILQKSTGKIFDIKHSFERFTAVVVCETTMGVKTNGQHEEFELGTWVSKLMFIEFTRIVRVFYHPDVIFYNMPLGREYMKFVKKFDEFIWKIIDNKVAEYRKKKELERQYPEASTEDDDSGKLKTFLDTLLELNYNGADMSTKQIRDEVATVLIGGFDTTAATLSYVAVMLGMHQEWQEKVYQEAMDVLGPDRPVECSDYPNLKLTERFILESSRLFPIAPLLARAVDGDVELEKGLILPKGSSVVFAILSAHRNEENWPDPLKFDPDRFLPEEIVKRHPYSFLPFAGGPRNCIGKKFAMLVMKTTISHLIRKFRFTTPYKNVGDVKIRQAFISQPVDGYLVQLECRE